MPRRHRVAALAIRQAAPFELAVACEVFGLDRPQIDFPGYDFRVVAAEPGPLEMLGGLALTTAHGLESLRWADTIIVPGWRDAEDLPPADLLDELRRAARRGARLLSFCSGAFVLAAAGLLDGRRAATHWMYAELLASMYPTIEVDAKVLYVDDGQVLTSAGTAAGIDLCLHVVRLDFGAEVANAIARRMVVPPHRDGGQSQYVDAPVPCCPGGDPLEETMAWMAEHLDEPLTVEDLAARSAMSPRTFARRFRGATGTTPLQWIVNQRVLLAQRLLEATDLPVEHVATRCGFGSAAALRLHFSRVTGTSPLSYRRTFKAEARSA